MLEYTSGIRDKLPADVTPVLGPDATGIGWVFEYALVDRRQLVAAWHHTDLPADPLVDLHHDLEVLGQEGLGVLLGLEFDAVKLGHAVDEVRHRAPKTL